MIKSLLRKSQAPSLEDEFVGSVSTLYPSETISSTPTPSLPPPGFATKNDLLTAMPSGSILDKGDDTLIVLPNGESTAPGKNKICLEQIEAFVYLEISDHV